MTLHYVGLASAALIVLIGLALALPRRRVVMIAGAAARPRPRVSARQLGLAHRFAARVIVSRVRPADENFVEVAELYALTPRWSVLEQLAAYLTPVGPLVEVEELLEKLDRFSVRIRRWGRRRGQS